MQKAAPLVVGSSECAGERRRARGREQKCERAEENQSRESCGLSGSAARAVCVSHRLAAFPRGPPSGAFARAGRVRNAGSVILAAFIVTRFQLEFCGLFCRLQRCN